MNKPSRSNEIQGLRAICIALVVMLHYVGPFRDVLLSGSILRGSIYRVANTGWIGVDIFFAISGFVVTQVLLRTKDDGYLIFMIRRAKRLLPAYFLLLAVAGALALWAAPFEIRNGFLAAQPWAWFFAANVAASINGGMLDGGDVNLVHLWSLCVEFQFYAVWPFVVWGVSGQRRLFAMVGIAIIAFLLRCWASWDGVYYNAIYSLTFFRMDAFAFGGIAALAVGSPRITRWSFPAAVLLLSPAIAYLVSTVAWHKADPLVQTLVYSLLGAGAASLVLALFVGAAPDILKRMLTNSVMTGIGNRSYSLYLWHLPFQAPVNAFLHKSLTDTSSTKMMVASVLMNSVIAIVLSELSYRLLENMRSKNHSKVPESRVP
jgi:peptidoglycan/LPS O-acetylase OafA/YrhL